MAPIAVGAHAGGVQALEHLVIYADGKDIELFPRMQTLGRRERLQGFVRRGDCARKVVEQGVGHLHRQLIERFARSVDAVFAADGAYLRLAQDRQVDRARARTFERQHALTPARAMRRRAGGQRSQHIARNNQVGIGSAHPVRSLLRDLARAHEAILAADARDTERALRLLTLEAVEHGVDADLLHAQQHLAHGRVGSLLNLVLFGGKRLFVGAHRLRVIMEVVGGVMVVMSRRMLGLALRDGLGKRHLVDAGGVAPVCYLSHSRLFP